jgi:hypothetical protein
MPRTIAEIQAEIIAQVQAETLLADLNSASVSAIWRLWTYIVATAIWTLEVLFYQHLSDVNNLLAALKPHTLRWYAAKAKAFQFGYALALDTDLYDNAAFTPTQIAASKIVMYSAAVDNTGGLTLKVAKTVGNLPTPLSASEYAAFAAYIAQVKDAGVRIDVLSAPADKITLSVDIYYDATVLSSTGARLDGTEYEPVKTAINNYLNSLPFNGLFVKTYLTDAMQRVSGVVVPEIKACACARYDSSSLFSVDVFYQPYSGYLKFYQTTDLVITYIPYIY